MQMRRLNRDLYQFPEGKSKPKPICGDLACRASNERLNNELRFAVVFAERVLVTCLCRSNGYALGPG